MQKERLGKKSPFKIIIKLYQKLTMFLELYRNANILSTYHAKVLYSLYLKDL